ncbi:MAG: GNAT family N-acetyltransferase [Vicinamibacteria bacterium]|nr:GNAT family N-acetyltransferase [Vicinamibacteria bacterium]
MRHFGDSCLVAESNGDVAGFLLGFRSQRKEDLFFVWQIGVSLSARRQGVAAAILRDLEQRLQSSGIKRIECTIDPENAPSIRLFESLGYVNVANRESETIEVKGHVAAKDFYKPGRHFTIYEKQLDSRWRRVLTDEEERGT